MRLVEIASNIGAQKRTLTTFDNAEVKVYKIRVKDNEEIEKMQKDENPLNMMYFILSKYFRDLDDKPVVANKEDVGEFTIEQISEINKIFSEVNKLDIEQAKKK